MDMTEKRDLIDLERRLAASLHGAAPRPTPDDVDRLLRAAVSVPQRHGPFGLSFAPMLAAAVVVLAVAVGFGLGGLLNRGSNPGGPSDTPVPSVAPSESPSASPSPSSVVPTPSPESVFPGGDATCENESIGFAVTYPADWWANEVVDDNPDGDPILACQYFAEEPVELIQNAGLPDDIAIIASLEEQPLGNPEQPIEVLNTRDVEIDGITATAEEIRWTEDTGFQSAGHHAYRYRIPLGDGRVLLFGVTDQPPSEQYDARKEVLDRMMGTLEITGN
jgi:hypothetical protein